MKEGSTGAGGAAGGMADRRQKEKSLFPSRFCSSSLWTGNSGERVAYGGEKEKEQD